MDNPEKLNNDLLFLSHKYVCVNPLEKYLHFSSENSVMI
jgi:hypothetical protein